ncbi:unnamed protein product [Heligmosomoides polygyrus]|uniref:Uncharacterized protein n=1 Tax=Heligmosomoides polygyrus TaxID=6339 RepID=A0A183FED4_HELPZ|nr:unnamed protein product [Heligmosomoides polygyrus]
MGRTSTEKLLKSQGLTRLRKLRTGMTICTYNARTLASESSVEDLMMEDQVRRHRTDRDEKTPPLHADYGFVEELFLGTCESRGVGGVGVHVNTMASITTAKWSGYGVEL